MAEEIGDPLEHGAEIVAADAIEVERPGAGEFDPHLVGQIAGEDRSGVGVVEKEREAPGRDDER
jgi:hypothetical protein